MGDFILNQVIWSQRGGPRAKKLGNVLSEKKI